MFVYICILTFVLLYSNQVSHYYCALCCLSFVYIFRSVSDFCHHNSRTQHAHSISSLSIHFKWLLECAENANANTNTIWSINSAVPGRIVRFGTPHNIVPRNRCLAGWRRRINLDVKFWYFAHYNYIPYANAMLGYSTHGPTHAQRQVDLIYWQRFAIAL